MTANNRIKEEIGALILAAGLSSRMGKAKMLLPWGDSTVIRHVVNSYISTEIMEIVVVTGGTRYEIEKQLSYCPVRLVFNPRFENGEMLDSLKAGICSFPDHIRSILVAPGDHPAIGRNEIDAVIHGYLAGNSPLVVPSYRMRRGHPWAVERSLWEELLKLEAPETLRDFLRKKSDCIHYVAIDNPSILMDMDTPDDYDRLKKW
jgi:molybdenum cofactor cytidylyltransferase